MNSTLRQLFQKAPTCFSKYNNVKQLRAACFHKQSGNSSRSEQNTYKSNQNTIFYAAAGIGFGITAYLFSNKTKKSIIPKIEAADVFKKGNASENPNQVFKPSSQFNFIADVVEKVAPAVVYVDTQSLQNYGNMFSSITQSNGSGFIINSDGIILTNAHVVGNYSDVSVKLHDGRVFKGYVQYLDKNVDLAIIKINATNLPVLPLSKSALRPGEWVVAMGSPLSLSNTITIGLLSSIRHCSEIGMDYKDMEYLQTDAAITFGNSGGPLVNLEGEAIGINSMKVADGISFAVPSYYALQLLEKASKGQPAFKPKKGSIGITMITLNRDTIRHFQSSNPNFPNIGHGVLIWQIINGSPAHVGGLQVGDVIVSINDNPITNSADVYYLVKSQDKLVIEVLRESMPHTIIIEQ